MLSRSRTIRILGLTLALAAAPSALGLGRSVLAQVPGRDAFAREPRTPLETWEVAHYLIRIGQPDQAAPYLKKFVDAKPDDATILDVRDAYGVGSILRLSDYPETRPYAKILADRLAEAAIRTATNPDRIERAIAGLSKSKEEQSAAVDRLREAGSYAIPPLVRALSIAGLENSVRTAIADNLGQLDRNAVPALIAALDSSDSKLVGDVARALGRIGDPRSIPALTFLAAQPNPVSFAQGEVVQALRKLTGRDFGSQAKPPVRVLTDEARRYYDHLYRFPGDPLVLWLWDASGKVPVPAQVSVREAEGILGLRYAREALEVDPTDVEAKVVQLSLGLDHDPANWRDQGLASGPAILGQVLRRAVAERRNELAGTVVPFLGQLANRNDLLIKDKPNALVDALMSGDRRTQLAAAEALVKLDPRKPFPGSSRVVPVLSRFLSAQSSPRALVIDGNAERASQVTGYLRELGYDARTAPTGSQGFTEAAESADIELIVIDPNAINDSWKLPDLLGNLKADPRTANIPIFLVGPLDLRDQINSSLEGFPDVKFLVTPSETRLLKQQLDRGFASLGVRPLSSDERLGLAKRSAGLLAQISRSPGSPFEADLSGAEPALSLALNGPSAGIEAAMALGDTPGTEAQRSLADAALDPSKPLALRLATSQQLARNIRRFGPRLASAQEKRLVEDLGQEADPTLREAMAAIVGALRPLPDASASLFPTYRPSTP